MMDKPTKRQIDAADRAVLKAAAKIERAVDELIDKAVAFDVAYQYVIEQLLVTLLERNPAALDELNHSYWGKASLVLSNALMDWRDQWSER
jgi:hypothetical protein